MKVSQQSAITDSVNALVGGLNVEESAVDEQDADACANCRRYNAAHLAHVQLEVADGVLANVAGVGVGHRGGHCVRG